MTLYLRLANLNHLLDINSLCNNIYIRKLSNKSQRNLFSISLAYFELQIDYTGDNLYVALPIVQQPDACTYFIIKL